MATFQNETEARECYARWDARPATSGKIRLIESGTSTWKVVQVNRCADCGAELLSHAIGEFDVFLCAACRAERTAASEAEERTHRVRGQREEAVGRELDRLANTGRPLPREEGE